MVDYDQFIGGNTTLRIRDTGSVVEFWVLTGASTWNNEQPWGYAANGANSGTLYARMLRGGNWQKFGQVNVYYDQDVRFTIVNSGLGFPSYDFWHHISRTTTPAAPFLQQCYAISSSYIHVEFAAGYDGGSPVVEWQIGYGSSPDYPEAYWGSGGTSDVGPFSSGQRVYVWARGRNSLGWGPWSNRGEATTWRVPDAPQSPSFSNITQVGLRVAFDDRYDGGTGILERQIGYGLSSVGASSFANAPGGVVTLSNLSPGKTYYFWSRSRNSVGWGSWSAVSQTNLIAGARVLNGGVWKRAVPYVKVSGVWKVAEPWVRNAGEWKKTSS